MLQVYTNEYMWDSNIFKHSSTGEIKTMTHSAAKPVPWSHEGHRPLADVLTISNGWIIIKIKSSNINNNNTNYGMYNMHSLAASD